MTVLQLTRARQDRRLYVLEGVGTLRLTRWASRTCIAEAGSLRWQIARRGFRRAIQATDAAGTVVGDFERRGLRGASVLSWAGRDLALRRQRAWRARYRLVEGGRELATIEGRSWGRRPVTVTLDDTAAVEPGLLLFAAFVVRALAVEAAAAAS